MDGTSFIYASSDGMLRAHGHPAIVDVLTRHQDEILQHEAWTFGVGNRVPVDPAAQMPPNEAILPQLDQPVNKISNKQLRALITACVRQTNNGSGQPHWGNITENKIIILIAKCKETWHITGNINIASTYS